MSLSLPDAVYVDPRKEVDGVNHVETGVGNATEGTVADGVMGKTQEHDNKSNISDGMELQQPPHDNVEVANASETKDILPDSNAIRPQGLVGNASVTATGGVAYKVITPDETPRDGVPGLKTPEVENPGVPAEITEGAKSGTNHEEAPQELHFAGRGQGEEIDPGDVQNRVGI